MNAPAQQAPFWEYADALVRRNFRFFFYGPLRCGKTELCASFPRPIFIFPRNENSEETIRGRVDPNGVRYPFRKVGSRAEMQQVLDVLLSAQRAGQIQQFCQTVCLESMTHYTELLQLELTDHGKRNMNWNELGSHLKHIKDVLWQLDCHVVVTSLAMSKQDKNGNVTKAGVSLPGQSAETFVSSCDLVGYMEQVQGPGGRPLFMTHVQHYGMWPAGTRIRGFVQGDYPNFNFREHLAPIIGG